MKAISNQKILTIARLCKEGKSLSYIQRYTGVKSAYSIASKLRKSGANIPLPPKKEKKARNWDELAQKINQK